jgi:hypothetical protein
MLERSTTNRRVTQTKEIEDHKKKKRTTTKKWRTRGRRKASKFWRRKWKWRHRNRVYTLFSQYYIRRG